jgi:acylphosphatase
MEVVAVMIAISGRVQGVGYRAWFSAEARSLGLCGWVRNRADGGVEAMVEGNPAAIARLLEAARKGPAHARVLDLQVTSAVCSLHGRQPSEIGFVILPTA